VLGQFQRVDKPWVAVSFDTMEGEAMMEATGVAVCPHCQHAARTYGSRNNRHAKCPNCRGGLFD
jgi:Zn finger protein HypA/HybF involved in hydrogenase expression